MKQNIGVEVAAPKKTCTDKKCPFHGAVRVRGRQFIGRVISSKMSKTVTVEWSRQKFWPKYERYETLRSRLKAHNPDCINAKDGQVVRIMETRPLSKTKNFTVIEVLGESRIVQGEDLTAKPAEKIPKGSKKVLEQAR